MELRWLALVVMVVVSLPSPMVCESHKKRPNDVTEQHENLMQEEQKSECPEFCTCGQKTFDGVIAKCVRITESQHFNDRYSDFKLLGDSKNTNEAITLDDGFFIHLQMKSIQSITIVDFKITSIDKDAFRELQNLRLVNLTNNSLEEIHPETFASNKNMRLLSLSGNPLAFEDTIKKALSIPYLEELDLSSCHLNTLTNTFFSKLTLLTYLNLASNNLNVIDSNTFSNLTSLEELNLSNNNIQSLNGDLFIYNQALAHLVLRNNPLITVENTLLPGVTYLDLSSCKFTQISESSFNGVLGVTNLNLSHNMIAEISVGAFAKLPKLAYLDLSDNSLDSPLDDSLFAKNSQLETLSLKSNPNMKLLPEGGFKGKFDELFKLNIANCGIERLPPALLENLPSLSQLDLSHNLLASFKGDTFLDPNVKHLNLAFNKITDSNDILFPITSQLQKLSLAGNKIEHLQSHFFDNLRSLTTLDLSDCEMGQLWENNHEEIHTLPKLNTINLSGNNLKKITHQDLEVFNNLEMLNLNANPLVCDSDLKDLADYLTKARVGSFNTRHASEATYDAPSWQDFLHSLACAPNAHSVERGRLSNYDDYEYSEDGIIRCFFDHYDNEDNDYEDTEGEGERKEENEEGNVNGRNKVGDQDGETTAQQHIYGSSVQIIVMLVAAITTFVVIVAFVVSIILCRSRMLLHRETMAKRRGHGLNIYKPLHDNEHFNSPTTPIMKPREVVGSSARDVGTVSV